MSSVYDIECDGFTIETTVTASGEEVQDWINDLRRIHWRRLHKLVVGLDAEWFQQNPVATLQLCVGHRCLVFQIGHADYIPVALCDFLEDQDFTFVGQEVGRDANKLREDYDLVVANYRDLAHLAACRYQDRSLRGMGLKNLASQLLGIEIEKSQNITRSRWDAYHLNYQQVHYACLDAYVSFKLGVHLSAFSPN